MAGAFTLKKAAGRGRKTTTPPAASPSIKTQAATLPPAGNWLRGASGAVLGMVCVLGRQLLNMAGMEPRWTGFWVVLEAGDGTAASPFTGKVINCAVGANVQQDDFAKDWWEFRGGWEGRRRRQQAAAQDAGGGDRPSSGAGAGGGSGQDDGGPGAGGREGQGRDGSEQDRDSGSGDAASSDSAVYPLIPTHTRGTIAAVAGRVLGTKVLATADLNKVLARAGLEDVREITSDDVMDLFTAASRLLRQRADSKSFSWALCCPLELLGNTWTTPALAVAVDGSHYLPLSHPSSKGHGTDRKRLVLCVAAHVSPFWAKVLEVHFATSRASGRKKRYRPKDPFDGAEDMGGKTTKKKRQATNQTAAAKKARTEAATAARLQKAQAKATKRVAAARAAIAARAEAAKKAEATRASTARASTKAGAPLPPAPPPSGRPRAPPAPPGAQLGGAGPGLGGGAAGDSGGRTTGAFRTTDPLWALERAAVVTRMRDLWTRRAVPVLPATTVFSVVLLSGPLRAAAVRASTRVRVVLPRALLKNAFAALATAARSGNGVPDGHELAVRLGDHEPVYAFEATLDQMSSVLAFNEGIVSAANFACWMRGLAATDAHLPAPLNFLSGESVAISSMVNQLHDKLAGRLLGDCVWSLPPVRRGSAATEKAASVFSGYVVNVRDVCDAGQREWITNALLDAGLAGLQSRCDAGSVPIGVLSSSQSASFTHVGGRRVSLEGAVPRVLEVLDSWSASVTRFVMVLNVDNCHWMSASVSLSTGQVTLYDSLGGPSPAKTHITSRLHLFARYAEQRWRATHPDAAVGVIEWQFDEVNTPRQVDGYNCGLFAVAFIWCFVFGLDMTTFPVDGDQLRLSLIYYVLMSGAAREEKQRA